MSVIILTESTRARLEIEHKGRCRYCKRPFTAGDLVVRRDYARVQKEKRKVKLYVHAHCGNVRHGHDSANMTGKAGANGENT